MALGKNKPKYRNDWSLISTGTHNFYWNFRILLNNQIHRDPSSWGTSLGTYTATVDVSSANLSGNGTWVVMAYNGYQSLGPGYIQCVGTVVADGVCADPNAVMGCMDTSACNYNPAATYNDGSCSYPQESLDCDGNCVVDVDGDGICDEVDDCLGQLDACGVCNGPGFNTGYCIFHPDCEILRPGIPAS